MTTQIFLLSQDGTMNQILHWLPELERWSYLLARSGFEPVSRNNMVIFMPYNKLVKLVGLAFLRVYGPRLRFGP